MNKEERIKWLEQYDIQSGDTVLYKTECADGIYGANIDDFLVGYAFDRSAVGVVRYKDGKLTLLEPRPKPKAEEHPAYRALEELRLYFSNKFNKQPDEPYTSLVSLRDWLRQQIEKGKL